MFRWLKKRFRTKTVSFLERPEGIPINKFKDYESYIQAGARKVWATWKAIDLIAQAVSETPFDFYKKGTSTKTKNPQLAALFQQPNPFETITELLYLIIFHVRLTGNAFMVKDQTNLKYDQPRQLFLLNPKLVKIVPDKTQKIKGYIWRSGSGTDVPFEPEEIVHFKRPHPDSDYYGLGDMEAGEPLFNDFINRENWSEKFWRNGASPSGLLVCEDQITDQAQWDQAKAKFQKEYGGVENSGKTAWLTGKWAYTKLGLSAVDMQDLQKQQHSEEAIFHLHGVPLSVAGVKEAANYATAEIDEMIFRRYSVKPMVKLIRDTLQSDIVDGFDPNIEIKFDVSGLINMAQVVVALGALFDRGVMSINEMRDAVGMAKDDNNPEWNQHFINAGLVPLELAGVANQQQTDQAAQDVVKRFIAQAFEKRRLGNGEHEASTVQTR